jgi:Sec-independent protein translocase protein TatA
VSGRPKPGRPAPGSEAEQLRELTREAHEAARDLRQALREAREETHQLQADHVAALGETMAAAGAAVSEELENAAAHLQAKTFRVTEHIARLLGAADQATLVNEIAGQAGSDLARMLSAELELPPGAKIQIRQVVIDGR